jgi:uncharacterized membrane protein
MDDLTETTPGKAFVQGIRTLAIWWVLIKVVQLSAIAFGYQPLVFGLILELMVVPYYTHLTYRKVMMSRALNLRA